MQDKRTDPQFKLRYPPELKTWIEDAAKASNRTINAEIILRLKRSFDADNLGFNTDLLDVIALQSTLTATLCRTLDWSKLDEHETNVLKMLHDVSERIISKLHISKTGVSVVNADE